MLLLPGVVVMLVGIVGVRVDQQVVGRYSRGPPAATAGQVVVIHGLQVSAGGGTLLPGQRGGGEGGGGGGQNIKIAIKISIIKVIVMIIHS